MKKETFFELLIIIYFIEFYNPIYSIKHTKLRYLDTNLSSIKITYEGSGTPYLINEDFNHPPDLISFNGTDYTMEELQSIELDDNKYYFTLIWNNDITNCSRMFERINGIEEIDLSNYHI